MRRFTRDDAAAYLPLVSLSEVIRFTGERALGSRDEVVQLLEARQLRDYELHGYGRMACIEKATGQLIGFSGLKYLDDIDETDFSQPSGARATRQKAQLPLSGSRRSSSSSNASSAW